MENKKLTLFEQIKLEWKETNGYSWNFRLINNNGIVFEVLSEYGKKRFSKDTRIRATAVVGTISADLITIWIDITQIDFFGKYESVTLKELMESYSYKVYNKFYTFEGETVQKRLHYLSTENAETIVVGSNVSLHYMFNFTEHEFERLKEVNSLIHSSFTKLYPIYKENERTLSEMIKKEVREMKDSPMRYWEERKIDSFVNKHLYQAEAI